jgi:hypothetical protein
MKRILDPAFRYRPSFDTDLKETFARIRLEQQATPVKTGSSPAANSADDRIDAVLHWSGDVDANRLRRRF